MATYAIGDIQGCFRTLQRLLQRIAFDPRADVLWLVGDLVNRGPDSLSVLRWARELAPRIHCVMGNHDLHLLAVADGLRPLKPRDTLRPVLDAPDAAELLAYLAARPVLYREGDWVLLHGGLHPAWSVDDAMALGRAIDARLGEVSTRRDLLVGLYDEPAEIWSPEAEEVAGLRAALRALVSLRTCDSAGRLCASFSGPPSEAPAGCVPWFDVSGRRSAGATLIFGHWAALGLHLTPELIAIDTGCVWGGTLTAVRLEDRAVFQEPSAEGDHPSV